MSIYINNLQTLIGHICVYKCMTLAEIVASSPQGSLVGDSRCTSSPMRIKNHLLSTATNLNRYMVYIWTPPNQTHTLPVHANLLVFLVLSFHPCRLSLFVSVSWHSRAMSQMAPHALSESHLLPWNPRATTWKKDAVLRKEEKRRIPPVAKVCPACWGLIKDRLYKKSKPYLDTYLYAHIETLQKGHRWSSRALDDSIRITCTCLASTLCQIVISG